MALLPGAFDTMYRTSFPLSILYFEIGARIEALPPELENRILQYLSDSELRVCLRVSSEVRVLAGPILYRNVQLLPSLTTMPRPTDRESCDSYIWGAT